MVPSAGENENIHNCLLLQRLRLRHWCSASETKHLDLNVLFIRYHLLFFFMEFNSAVMAGTGSPPGEVLKRS